MKQIIPYFFTLFRKNSHLRWPIVGLLFSNMSWFLYYQYIALYLANDLHFQPQQITLFIVTMVSVYFVTLLLIFPILLRRAGLIQIIKGSLLTMSISIGLPLFFKNELCFIWLWSAFFVSANSVLITAWMNLFSNQVAEQSQGWAMGLSGSVYAMSWLFAAL